MCGQEFIFGTISMTRSTKRGIIIAIYISLFIGFSFLMYQVFKPAPTCTDGKRNQNEAGVDCGGVCGACEAMLPAQDLQIGETALVYGGPQQYDVLAEIYNPNDRYGASEFVYTFLVKDAQGAAIATRSGKSFILPRETKHLIEVNLPAMSIGQSVTVDIQEVKWETFSGYRERPSLNVYSKRFDRISSGTGFGEAYGVLANESGFDFQSLIVKVILRDASGKPVALNTTEMRTVPAGERRDFRLVWPTSFPGDVERVDTEVEADVYRSDNFIRQYIPGSPLQGF
jgi:hypothetical protein